MKTIDLIQVVEKCHAQKPKAFYLEEEAGSFYEKLIHEKFSFRPKVITETWDEYKESFTEFYNSNELFMTNIEVTWYTCTIEDSDLIPDISTNDFHEVTKSFDGFEIHPCKQVDSQGSIEVCEPNESEFWSVYVHHVDGGLNCIADFQTKKAGEKFVQLIHSIISQYNGTITWSIEDFETKAREIEIENIRSANPNLADELETNQDLPIPQHLKLFDRSTFNSSLHLMIKHYDSNTGITWDDVQYHLEEHSLIVPRIPVLKY